MNTSVESPYMDDVGAENMLLIHKESLKKAREHLCVLIDMPTRLKPNSEIYNKVRDIISEIEEILGLI